MLCQFPLNQNPAKAQDKHTDMGAEYQRLTEPMGWGKCADVTPIGFLIQMPGK